MDDNRILVQYLRRSYQAVDGLWFVKLEEAVGFDRALELDRRVWEVLAKIQARKARELLEVRGNSLPEFARCFTLKLTADGFAFDTDVSDAEATFTIRMCPWLDLLRRAGRESLAEAISGVMCPTEGHAWCREFGEMAFSLDGGMCQGGDRCRMIFSRTSG